ncbi:hypothetical protein ABW19_dt0210115 [Dactylella cylindrospora]|nr:hypothetical protein ABW19_dt0210115 [Dactylella cylindrospora]
MLAWLEPKEVNDPMKKRRQQCRKHLLKKSCNLELELQDLARLAEEEDGMGVRIVLTRLPKGQIWARPPSYMWVWGKSSRQAVAKITPKPRKTSTGRVVQVTYPS